MPEARLYEVLARQRAALLRGERAAAGEMVRVYGELWRKVRTYLDEWLAFGAASGDDWVYERARLERLLTQIGGELQRFAPYAEGVITEQQRAAVAAALRDTQQQIAAVAGRAGVSVAWAQLPTGALEALVGFTADGSPLRELLERIGPGELATVRDALLEGMALGQNPTAIARRVRQAFGGDLTRALRVCRTETLRAYREATIQSYAANEDTVSGWMWLCACTPRSCAACWAMHGTIHPLTERLEGHVNCRCTAGPVTRDIPGMGEQWLPADGPTQFAKLAPDEQRKVLGPLYPLYRDGKIELGDVVKRRFDRDWGTTRGVKSLREMVGKEEARKRDTTPGESAKSIPPIDLRNVQSAEIWAREYIADQVDFSQAADLQSIETVSDVAQEFREKYGLQKLEGLRFDASEQWRDNGRTRPNRRFDNATVTMGLQTDTTRDLARLQAQVRTIEEVEALQGSTAHSKELWQLYTDQIRAVHEGRFDVYGVHSEYAFRNLYEATARHELAHAWHIQHDVEISRRLGYPFDELVSVSDLRPYAVTVRALSSWAECIAENFTLYSVGLRDRIHPDLLKLFEELIR